MRTSLLGVPVHTQKSTYQAAVVMVALIIAFASQQMSAQDYLQAVGRPVFTSAEPVESGFIDAANGDLHLEIPIATFPQRGSKPLVYKLVYDSRIWNELTGGVFWPNTTASPWAGWRFVSSADMGLFGYNSSVNFCGSNPVLGDQIYNGFYWQAPDGTTHFFSGQIQETNNCGGTVTLCTTGTDASGYSVIFNTSQSCAGSGAGPLTNIGHTVLAPDGTQVYADGWQVNFVKDTNGNYYSRDSNNNVIDTLGRTPVVVTSSCGTNQTCYDVLTSQGGTTKSRWIVTTESISVNTAFPVGTNYSGNFTAIKSITLPDGTSYQFSYNSGTTAGHYGELTSMTLPTGGQVSYGYSVYEDAHLLYNRWVTKHTSAGATSYILGSVNTTNLTQNVTVTKPSGDYKIYSFQLQSQPYFGQSIVLAPASAVSFYSSGGTLLQTINNTYGSSGAPLLTESVTLPTPSGNITKQKTFAYGLNPVNGRPTTINEWNYYTGRPATNPDRITNVTYLSDTNYSYLADNMLMFPSKIQVTNGSGTLVSETDYSYDTTAVSSKPNIMQHDDAGYGTSRTTRANRTQVQQWTGSSYLTTSTMTYDETGQLVSTTDSNNNSTAYSYADCYLTGNPPVTYTPSQATNAFPTLVTLPASGITSACYYYNTGKTAWTKDQNLNQTSYFYVSNGSNDPLDRLITTTLPAGGWVLNGFSTPATTLDTYTAIQTSTPSTGCSSCRHDQSVLDSYSRPIDQFLVNDPDGKTTVQTDYDANGRMLDTSHPYRSTSDPTYGLETNSYDGMDRVTQVSHPDSTAKKLFYGSLVGSNGGETTQLCPAGTCHLGYPTLVKDESGKIRQYWTDGFGNVVEVDEPTASATAGTWGSTPTVTYYLYDLLGNLLQATVVSSSECSRSYQYDGMSRLTQSIEPEVGNGSCSTHMVTYSYTASGGGQCSGSPSLLCSRTDERSKTVTYSYDGLNRLTGKSYSDSTAAVSYFYDQTSYNGLTINNGKGRRTGMSDSSGWTAWSYDANGNKVAEERSLGSVTKTTSYAYNLDNSLKQITYPTGRVVNFTVGNAQRPTSVVDGNGAQYVLPPSSGWEYEPSGSLASALYGKTSSFAGITETRTYNNRLQLTGVTASSTGGTPMNLSPSYNANGEISTITNSVDTGRNQTFAYDGLSRITAGSSQATSGADCWGQSFTIDNIGNLTGMTVSKCSSGSLSAAVNQNNQFTTGYTYDAAGNLTGDGTYTYSYNAENEITNANGVNYRYDGDRRRVYKSSGTMYWRDPAGNTLVETNASGTDVNDYIFFAGRRIARIDSSANVYYYQADQIGSVRTIVSSSGALCFDADYAPYGLEMDHTSTCPQNYKFAGYERDSETGLDYAMNRYYNYRVGRFMTPDPSGISSATLQNPQSLHLYAYVLNNPLIAFDPLGLECAFVSDNGTSIQELDATDGDFDQAACVGQGGYYFEGNAEVNFDAPLTLTGEPDWTVAGTNWNLFDVDKDSNWVGLTNDYGVPQQASCVGSGDACSNSALSDMGSDYANRVDSMWSGWSGHANFPNGLNHWNFGVYNYLFPTHQQFCRDTHNNIAFDEWAAGGGAIFGKKIWNPISRMFAGSALVMKGIEAGFC